MRKFMIILVFYLVIATLQGQAQETYTLSSSDSISYQYYSKGDWENLIRFGKESIRQNIDFKWLRQRLGYAYFVKGDYYASQLQYEKALNFDKKDDITLTYLYYCGLYTNNESFARYQAGSLPVMTQKRIGVNALKILDALDVEYNYKLNSDHSRSNPGYYRLGLNSRLGYRVNLYQALSTYSQHIDSTGIRQNEYFALVDCSITSHISLDIAYHYLSTNVVDTITYRVTRSRKRTVIDSTFLPGHLFYSKLSFRQNRFDLSVSGSILSYDSVLTWQYGIQAGVVLPGKCNIYLKSSLYDLMASGTNHLVFCQTAGTLVFKKLWVEGEITLGNQKNFAESNGLYIYNSVDATTFKTGISLFWYLTGKVTVFGNYSFNRKQIEYTDKSTSNYNQHSISSGIIWKI